MNLIEPKKEIQLAEPYVIYGNLKVRPAKKPDAKGKPRLYREVQKILAQITTSLSDDIIEDRNS